MFESGRVFRTCRRTHVPTSLTRFNRSNALTNLLYFIQHPDDWNFWVFRCVMRVLAWPLLAISCANKHYLKRNYGPYCSIVPCWQRWPADVRCFSGCYYYCCWRFCFCRAVCWIKFAYKFYFSYYYWSLIKQRPEPLIASKEFPASAPGYSTCRWQRQGTMLLYRCCCS